MAHCVKSAMYAAAFLPLLLASCGPTTLPTSERNAIAPSFSTFQACSPRSATEVPAYAAGSWFLPLRAWYPCNSEVKLVDQTGNATVANAINALATAMAAPGIPVLATNHSSPDYTVSVTYTGGSGPWSGAVNFTNGVPSNINFNGSCTDSCGSLADVALNELTALYGMNDSSTASKWDTFSASGISDHCAALGPAKKAHEGTICRFEIEAVWWKYGLIDSLGPYDRHIITGLEPMSLSDPDCPLCDPMFVVVADTLRMAGLTDGTAILTGFRPQFSYGVPGLCTNVSCESGTFALDYSWSSNDIPELLEDFTPNDSSIVVYPLDGQVRIAAEVAPSELGWFSRAVDLDVTQWIGLSYTLVQSSSPLGSFDAIACSRHWYGGKWYVRWIADWSSTLGTGARWSIVESAYPDPTLGSLIATDTIFTRDTLPDYAEYGAPTAAYFYIRYEEPYDVGWLPMATSPIDLSACAL